MTGLASQIARIDFTGGLETKEDERLVVPTKLIACQNATFSAQNSLTRRQAYEQIVASLSSSNSMATYNDEVLVAAGADLYALADSTDVLYAKQAISNIAIAKEAIRRTNGTQDQLDGATTGGLSCYVWRDLDAAGNVNGVVCQVRDEASGSILLSDSLLRSSATAWCPRVVAVSGGFLLFYTDQGNQNLYAHAITTGAPTSVSAALTIATDVSTFTNPGVFDACLFASLALVAYPSSNATNSVRALLVTLAGANPSVSTGPSAAFTQASLPDNRIGALCCAAFSTTRAGIYALAGSAAPTPGLWGVVLSNTLTTTAAEARLDATAAPSNVYATITAVVSGATMHVFSDDRGRLGGAAAVRPLRLTTVTSSNTAPTSITYQGSQILPNGPNGPFIAGKAFVVFGGPAPYLPVAYQTTAPLVGASEVQQSSWFLVEDHAQLTAPSVHVVARALYFTYGSPGTANASSSPPSVFQLSSSIFAAPVPELALLSFDNGANITQSGFSRVVMSFNTSAPFVRSVLGGNLFFAGASVVNFDGVTPTEAGFFLYPENVTVADGGAGAITAGTRQYVALYEWIDGAGQRHQSAPSPAVSFTSAASRRADVTIPTLFLTQKPDDVLSSSTVTIVVARTVDAGTTFYRVNAINAPIFNTTATATVTYADNVTDADLVGGELLYTTGGTLANIPPNPCSVLAVHQNRVFANDSEDPYGFQYSQPAVPNFGLQWSDLLRGRIDASGGKLTGIGTLDNKAVFFAERGIFVMVGTGPNATGAFNNYSTPERLPTDVGCVEPLSIIELPPGLIFKSPKGFYLLDRGLNVRYVGSAVAAYDAQTVTSAVLMADRQEVRFGIGAQLGPGTLVYSYRTDQWSVFSDVKPIDAVWWPAIGAYVFVTLQGQIRKTVNTHVGWDVVGATETSIVVTFTTAWIHLEQALHGFQRVYWLMLSGAYVGDSQLEIYAAYDDDPGTEVLVTSVASQALANESQTGWDLRVRLPRQKCRSIRFRVVDTPTVNPGGLSFSSMSLEVGVKRGTNKLPAGKSR